MVTGPVPFDGNEQVEPGFLAALTEHGIDAIMVTSEADLDRIRPDEKPGLALIDVDSMSRAELRDCVRRCSQLRFPAIALVPEDQVAQFDPALGVEDFLLSPPRSDELLTRARLLLRRTASPDDSNTVRVGDLVINTANYEVAVNGRRVNLRFKEYELLLLMASGPGRVYTRLALLERIWGYDYLGGTRTVDVHIRRLRSKIEDADHLFIETVWNVGYRFKNVDRAT